MSLATLSAETGWGYSFTVPSGNSITTMSIHSRPQVRNAHRAEAMAEGTGGGLEKPDRMGSFSTRRSSPNQTPAQPVMFGLSRHEVVVVVVRRNIHDTWPRLM